MTPHPQPEYIIPETAFNRVVAALRDNRQYDVAEYLIHGATPAAPATETKCNICILTPGSCLTEHDKTIRKAEREQVLNQVREKLSHIKFQEEDMWFIEATIKAIESLRDGGAP